MTGMEMNYKMQQNLWPVKALREENFSIDKLFEYKVGDQLTFNGAKER